MISLRASLLRALIPEKIRFSVFRGYRVSLRRAGREFKSHESNVVKVCFMNRAELQIPPACLTLRGGSLA